MYKSLSVIVCTLLLTASISVANAGPIMKMLEEKKAKSANSPSDNASPQTAAPGAKAAPDQDSKFDQVKQQCKKLGNKEGSDKFNSCVMTLME